MKYLRYPSLINSYALTLPKVAHLLNDEWYATEKINGANFNISVMTHDGQPEVQIFNRSTLISAKEVQYKSLFKLIYASPLIANMLAYAYAHNVQVNAYGEYFGHSLLNQKSDYDVDAQQIERIQIFNVFVLGTETLPDNKVPTTLVLSRASMAEIVPENLLVPIQKQGKLIDLLNDKLPENSIYGGHAEGYVYQPVNGSTFNNNNSTFMAIKHKTDTYLEVNHVDTSHAVGQDAVATLTVASYVTENRFRNVLSHGDLVLTVQNMKTLMDAFADDIVKEYMRDYPDTKITAENLRGKLKSSGSDMAHIIKKVISEQS